VEYRLSRTVYLRLLGIGSVSILFGDLSALHQWQGLHLCHSKVRGFLSGGVNYCLFRFNLHLDYPLSLDTATCALNTAGYRDSGLLNLFVELRRWRFNFT